jgi:hypothetical protein
MPKPEPTTTPPKSPQPTSPNTKQQPTSPSPQIKLSPPTLSPKTSLIEEKPLEEEEGAEGQELPRDCGKPPVDESRHNERLSQIQELLRSRTIPVTGRKTGTKRLQHGLSEADRNTEMQGTPSLFAHNHSCLGKVESFFLPSRVPQFIPHLVMSRNDTPSILCYKIKWLFLYSASAQHAPLTTTCIAVMEKLLEYNVLESISLLYYYWGT